MSQSHPIARAITNAFISPNVSDANFEAANLVDVFDRVGDALWALARTGDPKSIGAIEAHGEALERAARDIASALHDVAQAIRDHGAIAPTEETL